MRGGHLESRASASDGQVNVAGRKERGGFFLRAAFALGVMCGTSCSPGSEANGYWSKSCVSGDGRYLLAGGDHAALVDLSTGRIVERAPGMVKAVGCEEGGGVVVGYLAAVRLPGKTPVSPVPSLSGDGVLARGPEDRGDA